VRDCLASCSFCLSTQPSMALLYCSIRCPLLPLMFPRKSGSPSSRRYFLSWSFDASFVTPLELGHAKSVCCRIFARRSFSSFSFCCCSACTCQFDSALSSVAITTRSRALFDSPESNCRRASLDTVVDISALSSIFWSCQAWVLFS